VVDCLVLMIETSGADYLPVNVGSGETITILDIARMLNRILGKSIDPMITQTGRKFDIRHNTADISRARQTLGFRPKVALEGRVHRTGGVGTDDARCRHRLFRSGARRAEAEGAVSGPMMGKLFQLERASERDVPAATSERPL
jgi:hypothetical protein